jgi:hypothetical protein
MTTIVTRAGKGSPLTNNEVDTNFTNLNTAKVEGPGASVDGEIALYNSTSGALLKRASITGIVKATGGVAAAASAGTDYAKPDTASSWSANQTFGSGYLKLSGSSSGTGTLNAPAAASTYTWTLPAATGTIAAVDFAQTWSAVQSFNSGTLKLNGSSSGSATLNAPAAASTYTYTLPTATSTLGYLNLPAVGTKTGSYTLATGDVGKYVQVGSGGSITIPDATFSEGDIVSIFNNTTGSITITCSITTAYIAGTDTDKATMTLATRGVATILFISGTVCVVTGNVT